MENVIVYDIRTYFKETEPLEFYAIVTILNLCYDTLVKSMMIHMKMHIYRFQ